MNSCDRKWRDEKDVAELLDIANMATFGYLNVAKSKNAIKCANQDRLRYETIRDRRAAEDRNEAKV